ncbi:MAG: Asp-tRNA(Asn)/Glu-tRNA(Gln) amidotransferase subunit GatA [Candidatus Marinimicrobia bacterium]|nr:Asp-tRNA(Asn)/Glu-tRNA(Gln) amidotransferase subunit GatA [Candidatus Neomarinimicrobiota bacterium]
MKEMTKSSLRERTINIIEKIRKNNPYNAFINVVNDAVEIAAMIENKITQGKAGKLAGKIIGIKDNICVKGYPTTCASRILENFIPPYNATVVEKIIAEDGLIIGKTNLDEFAMGSSTEHSYFGPTRNPVNEKMVPGGSSGGSAAAVAGRLVDMALGSDTGGSIRQPASFCGVVGIKPTYGRVSRYGLVAFASSLDQIGVFAKNIYDTALLLQIISGYDVMDSTSVDVPVDNYIENLERDINGIKIGVPKEYFEEGLDKEIEDRIKYYINELEKRGAEIVNISLPHTKYTIATYYIIATAEASSNLARYDGVKYGLSVRKGNLISMYNDTRHDGFGNEVKRRIMLGTYVLSAGYYEAYYNKAQRVRKLIKDDFVEAFKNVDIILTPTSPTTAFEIGSKVEDPLSMYLSDIYTTSASLAGLPAMNIPAGKSKDGLPIGIQLIADYFKEETIFQVGHYIESEIGF